MPGRTDLYAYISFMDDTHTDNAKVKTADTIAEKAEDTVVEAHAVAADAHEVAADAHETRAEEEKSAP
jgi:hypothetical protein